MNLIKKSVRDKLLAQASGSTPRFSTTGDTVHDKVFHPIFDAIAAAIWMPVKSQCDDKP